MNDDGNLQPDMIHILDQKWTQFTDYYLELGPGETVAFFDKLVGLRCIEEFTEKLTKKEQGRITSLAVVALSQIIQNINDRIEDDQGKKS